MRRTILTLAILALLLTALAARPAAQTFSGSYDWSDGGSDELSAEFRPDGEDRWKVTFRFKWNGKDHSWKGEATGSLSEDGTVSGTVDSGMGRRVWSFEAQLSGETLTGKHTEVTGGKKYETGTFSLAR